MNKTGQDILIYMDERMNWTNKELAKQHIFLAKDKPPSWWAEKFSKAKVCPSMRDLVANSIIVTSPMDITVEYLENGDINFKDPLETRGCKAKEPFPLIYLSHNSKEESGDFYEYANAINLKVHWPYITMANTEETPLRAMQMPATFYQKNLLDGRYTCATGEVIYPPGFRIDLINMLFVPRKWRKKTMMIRKGEVLGAFYYPDGIASIRYVEGKARDRVFTLAAPGGDYNSKDVKKGCPFKYKDI